MKNIDKIEHFIVWFTITLFSVSFLGMVYGVLLSLILGIIKEIYDEIFGSHFSWGDLLADILGILVALSFYIK